MAYRIVIRQDTYNNWYRYNPVLLKGEFGYESDTNKLKLGDGETLWRALSYFQTVGATGAIGATGIAGATGAAGADGATITNPGATRILTSDGASGAVGHTGFTYSNNTSILGLTGSIQFDVDFTYPNDIQKGEFRWDELLRSGVLGMGNSVVQQIGQEIYYPLVKNDTGATIPNGTPIMIIGTDGIYPRVTPAISDGSIPALLYLGVTTEDILNGQVGLASYFGYVNDINTALYNFKDILYVSSTIAGQFTTTPPSSPNTRIVVGWVNKSDALTGSIFIRYSYIPLAAEVGYDNDTSEMVANNVQSAIDELNSTKASVELLSSNIFLYPTTVGATGLTGGATGYYKMVTSQDDADYDDPAVNVWAPSTGSLSVGATGDSDIASTQLVNKLITDKGLFIGDPGILFVPTAGNIRRQNAGENGGTWDIGNQTNYARFYFKIYKVDVDGNEEYLSRSGDTEYIQPINRPGGGYTYQNFSASGILNDGTWTSNDRILIRYFADTTNAGENKCAYVFQFGGTAPIISQLPVPISVIPSFAASDILVDTSSFHVLLTGADSTTQKSLETLDVHTHETFAVSPRCGAYNKEHIDNIGITGAWQKLTLNDTLFDIITKNGFTFNSSEYSFVWDVSSTINRNISPTFSGSAGLEITAGLTSGSSLTLGLFINETVKLETHAHFHLEEQTINYSANRIMEDPNGTAWIQPTDEISVRIKGSTGDNLTVNLHSFNVTFEYIY